MVKSTERNARGFTRSGAISLPVWMTAAWMTDWQGFQPFYPRILLTNDNNRERVKFDAINTLV
jgi:hypothetical protein